MASRDFAKDGVRGSHRGCGCASANAFGRIALCGMIVGYDGELLPLKYPALMLTERLLVQGFIVSEHIEVWPEALGQLGTLVAQRKLHYRETVAQGIESVSAAAHARCPMLPAAHQMTDRIRFWNRCLQAHRSRGDPAHLGIRPAQ